jgi:hypothetical protein
VHPSTKNIFLPEKRFDIQRQSTYKKIVDKLNRIDLSCIENDILGDSYVHYQVGYTIEELVDLVQN